MKHPEVLVRVVVDHDRSEHVGDYHQWVTIDQPGWRMVVDRLCRSRGTRRWEAKNATKWVCNNSRCPAWGIVSDRASVRLLNQTTTLSDHKMHVVLGWAESPVTRDVQPDVFTRTTATEMPVHPGWTTAPPSRRSEETS